MRTSAHDVSATSETNFITLYATHARHAITAHHVLTPRSAPMKFARFFIDRPIFAAVLSILIFLVGAIAMWQLPIGQYPEVVPPSVLVRAQYPGANPKVIAETVAAPLEQEINGVENMLYMSSQATSDGSMVLTVTFRLGTDVDNAQVQVQNRVSQALPRLPEDVRRIGVTTRKASPDLLMVVHLTSPDGRYDSVYLRNYATLQIRDVLSRLPGMGEVRIFGAGDYSMRVWLDPDRLASRGLIASDVVRAIREQNVQVAAGVIGADPAPAGTEYQLNVTASGRLITEEQFGDIIVKTLPDGSVTTLKDVARVELGAGQYSLRSLLGNQSAVAIPIAQSPGANALELSDAVRSTMKELSRNFPEGVKYEIVYDPTVFVRDSITAVVAHAARGAGAGRDRGHRVPADLARLDHPAARGAGLDHRHVRADARVRLLDQRAVVVRPGARHRHRRRRRDRRRRERGEKHPRRLESARSHLQGHGGSQRPDHRDRAGARGRVRADRVHHRPDRRVLQAVRADDRDLHRDLGHQLADAQPGAVRPAAQAARREARCADPRHGQSVRRILPSLQPGVRALRNAVRERRARRARSQEPGDGRVRRPAGAHVGPVPDRAEGLHPGAGQAVPGDDHRPAGRLVAESHGRSRAARGRHRHEDAGRAKRRAVPGPVGRGLHQQPRTPRSCSSRSTPSKTASPRSSTA